MPPLHPGQSDPSSYNLSLFDRQRGTGESIQDIKARIGFISAEIQIYFNHAQPLREVVLS